MELGGAKREVAIYGRDRLQLGDARKQSPEGGIAYELIPSADKALAPAGQLEERLRLHRCFDERFLDVHVRSRQEGLTGGLEMHARRRADVSEIRLRFLEQGRKGGVSASSGALRESFGRLRSHVVDTDNDMRRRHAPEGAKMQSGHVSGADESDTEWSRTHHADPQ